MSSVEQGRTISGHVTIHDNKAVKQIIADRHVRIRSLSSTDTETKKTRLKKPNTAPEFRKQMTHEADASRIFSEWLSNKAVGSIQAKTDLEAKETKKMYDSVLQTEDTFVKELDDLVKHKEMLDLRKKEILYKKWCSKVYEPLSQQIHIQMNGPGYPQLQIRKRQLHKEYLEHVNRKGHVFLDVIAPDEYFAMALHPTRPGLLVAETKPLKDPVLVQDRERNEEERVIFRCTTGAVLSDKALAQLHLPPLPLAPLGRHGTECNTWIEMPLGDIESPVRMASSSSRPIDSAPLSIETMKPFRRRMHPDSNKSHFGLDGWAKSREQSIVEKEMRLQKRRSVPRTSIIVPQPKAMSSVGVQCDPCS